MKARLDAIDKDGAWVLSDADDIMGVLAFIDDGVIEHYKSITIRFEYDESDNYD